MLNETIDKQHGRIDRGDWIKDLSDLGWEGYANLHGRRQTIRVERERYLLKTGQTSTEVTCALASLPPTLEFFRQMQL